MTIHFRNSLIIIALLLFFAAGFLLGTLLFLRYHIPLFSAEGGAAPLLMPLLFSLIAAGIIYSSFRKTAAGEIFFFLIFLFSFSFEMFRGYALLAQQEDLPFLVTVILSRLTYAGRFTAVLALFCGSLFSVGLEHQRIELFLAVTLMTAMILAALIPIDTTEPTQRLIYESGMNRELLIIQLLIGLLGTVNFFLAAKKRKNSDYLYVAGALVFLMGGWFLTGNSLNWAALVTGYILLTGGTGLYGWKTHQIYLWY